MKPLGAGGEVGDHTKSSSVRLLTTQQTKERYMLARAAYSHRHGNTQITIARSNNVNAHNRLIPRRGYAENGIEMLKKDHRMV